MKMRNRVLALLVGVGVTAAHAGALASRPVSSTIKHSIKVPFANAGEEFVLTGTLHVVAQATETGEGTQLDVHANLSDASATRGDDRRRAGGAQRWRVSLPQGDANTMELVFVVVMQVADDASEDLKRVAKQLRLSFGVRDSLEVTLTGVEAYDGPCEGCSETES